MTRSGQLGKERHMGKYEKPLTGTVREMKEADEDAALAILNAAIIDGNATSRYECPTKEDWVAGLLPVCRFVYEENGRVLGFIVLHPFSDRPCYYGVGEISIYVDASSRGKGVGKALLQKVIDESAEKGFWCLTSNIYATNAASRALHESLGFREIGYRERLMKTIHGEWMSVVMYELRRQEQDGD